MAHRDSQSNASISLVNANSRERIGKTYSGTGLKTAESWEVLVKTGLGVQGMRIGRTFYLWPGQRISAVDMKPRNISFNLHRQALFSFHSSHIFLHKKLHAIVPPRAALEIPVVTMRAVIARRK